MISLKKISIISIILIILGVSLQTNAKNSPLKPQIKTQNYNQENKKEKWAINVQYPKITSKNTSHAKDFNQRIKKLAMTQVTAFNALFLEEQVEVSSAPYDLNIAFDITYLSANLISVLFTESSYSGGAHGNKESFSLNYDLKIGKILTLPNIFKKNTPFIDIISRESIQQILKKQGNNTAKEWVEEGAGKHIKNFTTWNITPIGLMMTFDPYQVASYAAGDFTTTILYQKFPAKIQSAYFSDIKK
jgi:hypothetical protein